MNQSINNSKVENQIVLLRENFGSNQIVALFAVYHKTENTKNINSYAEQWAFVDLNGFESLRGKDLIGEVVKTGDVGRDYYEEYMNTIRPFIEFKSMMHRNNLVLSQLQMLERINNKSVYEKIKNVGWDSAYDVYLQGKLNWRVVQSKRTSWATNIAKYHYQISLVTDLNAECNAANYINFGQDYDFNDLSNFEEFIKTGRISNSKNEEYLEIKHYIVQRVNYIALPPLKNSIPKDHEMTIPTFGDSLQPIPPKNEVV